MTYLQLLFSSFFFSTSIIYQLTQAAGGWLAVMIEVESGVLLYPE